MVVSATVKPLSAAARKPRTNTDGVGGGVQA